jgi:hypothetical protein
MQVRMLVCAIPIEHQTRYYIAIEFHTDAASCMAWNPDPVVPPLARAGQLLNGLPYSLDRHTGRRESEWVCMIWLA